MKEYFKNLLNEYKAGSDNPAIRSPSSKKFSDDESLLNQHLMLDYKKLSVPVSDDKVFKATNIPSRSGGHPHDNTDADDHGQGYTRPIIFGDYLKYLLNMNTEDYKPEHLAILEAVGNLTEEQLDELSKSTLARYIAKAHTSGTAAAADAEHAFMRGRKKNAAEIRKHNHTGEKREAGIKRAAWKLAYEEVEALDELSKKTLGNYIKKAHDDEHIQYRKAEQAAAVAKEYAKSNAPASIRLGIEKRYVKHSLKGLNRRFGIQTAVDKLTKEEVELAELSKAKIEKYFDRATSEFTGYHAAAKSSEGKAREHWSRKAENRRKGVSRAVKKVFGESFYEQRLAELNEQEEMISELTGKTSFNSADEGRKSVSEDFTGRYHIHYTNKSGDRMRTKEFKKKKDLLHHYWNRIRKDVQPGTRVDWHGPKGQME